MGPAGSEMAGSWGDSPDNGSSSVPFRPNRPSVLQQPGLVRYTLITLVVITLSLLHSSLLHSSYALVFNLLLDVGAKLRRPQTTKASF